MGMGLLGYSDISVAIETRVVKAGQIQTMTRRDGHILA